MPEDTPSSSSPPPPTPEASSSSPPPVPDGADPFFNKLAGLFCTVPTCPPLEQGTTPAQEEKIWSMICHIGPLLGLAFLPPLIIFLLKRDESPFIKTHAAEALNLQITIMILALTAAITSIIIIPVILVSLYGVLAMVATILGGVKAYEGRFMGMPLNLRIIK